MEIVLATTNLHKIREFRALARKLEGIDFLSLLDFPDYVQPSEDGETFEANAEIKATHAAKALDKFVLADDSGLMVPILGGGPGIHSRRYAGEGATDKENRKKLLEALQDKKNEDERSAYFACALVIASPERVVHAVMGRCEGWIAEAERGSNGFGYDALFVKHDYDKTFGELDDTIKNRISHRARAFEAVLPTLEGMQHRISIASDTD